MGAGFSITITTVDRATKNLDAVNKRLAAIRAPVDQLNKSFSTFGRLSGVTGVAKGFERIGGGAYRAFQNVARIVAPLSAITGAASVAGMYRMVDAWGQWGSQLGFAAQRIGITATALQAWQGAAILAGSSSDALNSGMQNLATTMYDAIGGRNVQAVSVFNTLGVAFDDGTRHTRNLNQVLPELADKIAAIRDPLTQARAATVFFGGATDELLPFLRRGSRGIADLQDRARRYGVINAAGVAGANRMREAQADLTLAVAGLANSISERLAPIVAPLVTQMAEWIARNRDWIATGIGGAVRDFANYLSQVDFKAILAGMRDMWHTADNLAQAFGGWKHVVEGVIALKLAGWAVSVAAPMVSLLRLMALVPGSGVTGAALASVGIPALGAAAVAVPLAYGLKKGADAISASIPGQTAYERAHAGANSRGGTRGAYVGPNRAALAGAGGSARDQAMAFFRAQGWSSAQAAGLVANLMSESHLNPNARGDGGSALGIGQWHPDRQADFARLFGHSIRNSSLTEQLEFVQWELQNTEKGAGNKLHKATTGFEAGSTVSRYYERPAAVEEAASNRGRLAERYAQDDAPRAAGARDRLDVQITVAGNQVTKSTARSSGSVNPPRILATGVGVTGAT